ncbi:MAG: cell division protein FtsH, partial [Planctomycetota bacterium]|nr:cell division protein FtsH [Planctomycetota bacterium]
DPAALAKGTPGYSGADLAAIVNEAAIMAVLADCDTIQMEHLDEATTKVRYGRKKTSMKIEEADLKDTAYHEAGHTLVAAKIEAADPPHKVTIVPRGRSLGSTHMLPDKETHSYGRKWMLAQVALLYGGRVAEEIFCDDISAGASDDISRATKLVRSMVSELGMSDRVGPVNYAERQGSDFLGTEVMGSKRHSEETARIIDEEIERMLREGHAHAKSILEENREAMERLTEGLMMYETLDRVEIFKLIEGADPASLRPKPPEEETPTPPAKEAVTGPETSTADGDDLPGFSGEAGLSPA